MLGIGGGGSGFGGGNIYDVTPAKFEGFAGAKVLDEVHKRGPLTPEELPAPPGKQIRAGGWTAAKAASSGAGST